MTDRHQRGRIPLRSKQTGDTLALVSQDGLLLWSKRRKDWEAFPLSELTDLYAQIVEKSGGTVQRKDESA